MNKKNELLYITADTWWDTDINVLPDLGKKFNLEVIVLSPKNGGKYPEKTLPSYIKFTNKRIGRSRKNPIYIIVSFLYAMLLLYKSWNRKTFWVVDNNIYYIFPLMLMCRRKNFIISYHNYVDHIDSQRIDMMTQDLQLRLFDTFHFQSKGQWEFFKRDFPNKKSFATTMQIKDFGFTTNTKKFFNNDLRTFLFFGMLRDYKHPEMFIKTANKFKGKANFIIAGNCKQWSNYEKMIEGNNEIRCDIRFINNNEIPEYFTSADFLILPYEDSTQSGPLLIAYNYNLPVIASNLDYFETMISDKQDGFLFESLNQSSLDDVVSEAIKLSDKEYDDIIYNQKIRIEKYKKESNFSDVLYSYIVNNNK